MSDCESGGSTWVLWAGLGKLHDSTSATCRERYVERGLCTAQLEEVSRVLGSVLQLWCPEVLSPVSVSVDSVVPLILVGSSKWGITPTHHYTSAPQLDSFALLKANRRGKEIFYQERTGPHSSQELQKEIGTGGWILSFLSGKWKSSGTREWWWMHNVNILKTTQMYNLKTKFYDVNYILIFKRITGKMCVHSSA